MKNFKTIISMMSGTSIDSIDSCLLKIFDDLSFEIIDSYSYIYPDEIREKLLMLANNHGSVKDVCFMNFITGRLFARTANLLLKKACFKAENVDFISTHGQTIYHMPEYSSISDIKTKSTLQIGDISVISHDTGIMTIGDFRTKDMAANGNGAPLVPFADKLIFGTEKNRLIQNIGGISNVTVLSKIKEVFAFDNGPGNMLIDYFTNKFFDKKYDKNGEIAASGQIDRQWLNKLLNEPYYKKQPTKATGRELFNDDYAEKILKDAPSNKYNIISTITNLTAKVIADSYKNFIFKEIIPDEIVLGGGGAYNLTLISYLKDYLPGINIKTHEDFNIPNKLKEAVAFAFLGYYTLLKKTNNIMNCTGADSPVIMGKISF